MGSVIDYIDCPRCGSSDCFNDFYYKTGEEYISCPSCGYYKGATIINRDKALNELTDSDWHIELVENPYGSFRIKYKEAVASNVGSIVDENEWEAIKVEMVLSVSGDLEKIEEFTLNQFIDGKIVETNILEQLKNQNQNG